MKNEKQTSRHVKFQHRVAIVRRNPHHQHSFWWLGCFHWRWHTVFNLNVFECRRKAAMQSQFDTWALFSLWKLVKCNGKRNILWSEERTHTQTRTQTPNVIWTELEIPSGVLAKMQLFLEEEATVLIFDLFYSAEQFWHFNLLLIHLLFLLFFSCFFCFSDWNSNSKKGDQMLFKDAISVRQQEKWLWLSSTSSSVSFILQHNY